MIVICDGSMAKARQMGVKRHIFWRLSNNKGFEVFARKRLAIIWNLRIRSLESYLDRRKRRDCQKEEKWSLLSSLPQCSGGIFVKNFQTGCEYAYHVNETKITYVNCLNQPHKFNKSCIICGNKKISLINYDKYNCVSDATFRFFLLPIVHFVWDKWWPQAMEHAVIIGLLKSN